MDQALTGVEETVVGGLGLLQFLLGALEVQVGGVRLVGLLQFLLAVRGIAVEDALAKSTVVGVDPVVIAEPDVDVAEPAWLRQAFLGDRPGGSRLFEAELVKVSVKVSAGFGFVAHQGVELCLKGG